VNSSWNLSAAKLLSVEEMRSVLEVAKRNCSWAYVFFAITSNTGLRLSEAAHIKSSDLEHGQLKVVRRKKRRLCTSTVDIKPALWDLLKEWSQMFDGYLFPGSSKPCIINRSKKGVPQPPEQVCGGGHLSLRTVQNRWALTLAEAGLKVPGRGIHTTRHHFATEFYKKTRDLRATQVALAHSSSTITEVYCHVTDYKEKINSLEAVL
jgi:integrase